MDIQEGKILISDPFLQDPNFARTIVLLTQHDENGSFGFVLNNEVELSIDEALKDDKLPKQNLDSSFLQTLEEFANSRRDANGRSAAARESSASRGIVNAALPNINLNQFGFFENSNS